MSKKKQKYYTVWQGFNPGVYLTWDECNKQISGFAEARYKSFDTLLAAEDAFEQDWELFWGIKKISTLLSPSELEKIGTPLVDSICVDAAWNTKTGAVEYRGVDTTTGAELFRKGPYDDGTNNIVEFLAIVHALALCKQNNWAFAIYTDSVTALSWIRHKNPRTKHQRTEKNKLLFDLLFRAETWLHNNTWKNKILKWETKAWGENPADFGRK